MSQCPCDKPIQPEAAIAAALNSIAAGQSALPRQVRSFPDVREAMLARLPTQPALSAWRARNSRDLGLVLLEMWAYVSDVLSFYDERIANESYLRTAMRRPSLRRLVELLGYLPAPGVAASVLLAALAEGRKQLVLPVGTAFRSDAFDDEPPQVFELTSETTIHPFKNEWTVGPVAPDELGQLTPTQVARQQQTGQTPQLGQFLVFQTIEFGLAKDRLVLVTGGAEGPQVSRVQAVKAFSGQDGRTYAEVEFNPPLTGLSGKAPGDIRVQVPTVAAVVTKNTIPNNGIAIAAEGADRLVYLDAIYRQLKEGDPVLVTEVGEETLRTTKAVTVSEESVFAIPDNTDISVPVTYAKFEAVDLVNKNRTKYSFHFAFVDAGRVATVGERELETSTLERAEGVPLEGLPQRPPSVFPGQSLPTQDLLLADPDGNGARVPGRVKYGTTGQARLRIEDGSNLAAPLYKTPLTVYGNLVHATRGETVFNEVLGSGDRRVAGQEFRLKKKPLTYVPASNLLGRESTLQIFVDGVRWREVRTFFGCGEQSPVYIVRHDDDQNTTVIFGDGVRGSRLPSGVNNVVATYRFGAGEKAPPAGAIQQLGKPVVGLRAVRSPVAALPGKDPDPPELLRSAAPRSVLLLGRAVSPADFQALAQLQQGVVRAQAEFEWIAHEQQAGVVVAYIGDAKEDELAKTLRDQAELGLSIRVQKAEGVEAVLWTAVSVAEDYDKEAVKQALRAVLLDPHSGPLARENAAIGGQFTASSLFSAMHSVEGVIAVRAMVIIWDDTNTQGAELMSTSVVCAPRANTYFDFGNGERLYIHDLDVVGPETATAQGGC